MAHKATLTTMACPFCGTGAWIKTIGEGINGSRFYRDCECPDCKKIFTQIYNLEFIMDDQHQYVAGDRRKFT
jgi:transposase-like protein